MRKITVFGLLFTLLLGGCETARLSTLGDKRASAQTIYAIPEDQAFQIANKAMTETFPGQKIDVVTGSVRGYKTLSRYGVEFFSHQVLVYAVLGTAPGASVRGYYLEVSGSGTTFQVGQAKNLEVYRKVVRGLMETEKNVAITNVAPAAYENAKWP